MTQSMKSCLQLPARDSLNQSPSRISSRSSSKFGRNEDFSNESAPTSQRSNALLITPGGMGVFTHGNPQSDTLTHCLGREGLRVLTSRKGLRTRIRTSRSYCLATKRYRKEDSRVFPGNEFSHSPFRPPLLPPTSLVSTAPAVEPRIQWLHRVSRSTRYQQCRCATMECS